METKVTGFCTRCGEPLVAGVCLHHGGQPLLTTASQAPEAATSSAERRPRIHWLVALLAFALLLEGAVTVVMFRRTGDADDRAASLKRELEELRSTLDSQGTRLSTLEGEIANSPETSDVAQEALDSVFTVESGSVQGSGFVVASQAGTSTVLTNYHVVASEWNSGGTVSLRRSDQTFFGTIVDVSIVEDLAAIEIPGIFPALPISLETSDVGSSVVVVGSPFGLDGTVVTGVLSSNRERELQFSAPISPGASGAPLMNEAGEVIGVVFSKVSGGGAEGLGFAVPMTHACRTVISCKQ